MICSVAVLIGGFDLRQHQPIGRTSVCPVMGWFIQAPNSKSKLPAGRNRKASLPANTPDHQRFGGRGAQ